MPGSTQVSQPAAKRQGRNSLAATPAPSISRRVVVIAAVADACARQLVCACTRAFILLAAVATDGACLTCRQSFSDQPRLTVSPPSPMLAHPLRAFILFAAAATAGARLIVHACAVASDQPRPSEGPKTTLKIKINRFCITFLTITGVKIHVLPLKISCRPDCH